MLEAASSIASDIASVKTTTDDPGMIFDQFLPWHQDESGVSYWRRGARTVEHYLQVAFWDQTESRAGTGHKDPGWSRQARQPSQEDLMDKDGCLRRYADHNPKST